MTTLLLYVTLLLGKWLLVVNSSICPGLVVTETPLNGTVSSWFYSRPDEGFANVVFGIIHSTPTGPTIIRSEDDGKTWIDLRSKFPPTMFPNGFGVWRMYQGVAPHTLYFLGKNGEMWYTSDRANTLELYYDASVPVVRLEPHPVKHGWLMGYTVAPAPYAGAPTVDYNVYVSKNHGATWTSMYSSISEATWGYQSSVVDSNVESAFVIAVTYNGQSRSTILRQSKDLFKTDDAASTGNDKYGNTIPMNDAFHMLVHPDGPIFFMKVSSLDVSLWFLDVFGGVFSPVKFPDAGDPSTTGFTLLNVYNGTLMFAVRKTSDELGNRRIADIYVTDIHANEFDLSLPNVVATFDVEVHTVADLPGLYIANAYLYDEETLFYEVVTLMTYNHGGLWFELSPPPTYTCPRPGGGFYKRCTLNLHQSQSIFFLSEVYQGIHSKTNAVGIIIATGQVGPGLYLSNTHEIFLSRDAGITWESIISAGNYVYDSANHASMIVTAKSGSGLLNSALIYSPNYGMTWAECDLPSAAYEVYSIQASINPLQRTFYMMSYNSLQDTAKIFYLDFNLELREPCQESDYEDFHPSGPLENGCIMGESYSVKRRRAASLCYVDEAYEKIIAVAPCDCRIEDYKCGACYKRAPFEGANSHRQCVWYCSPNQDPNPAPDTCFLPEDDPAHVDMYPVTSNVSPYVKIIGDQCIGGLDLTKVEDNENIFVGCPHPDTRFSSVPSSPASFQPPPKDSIVSGIGGWIGFLLVILIIILILIFTLLGMYLFRKLTENSTEKISLNSEELSFDGGDGVDRL